MIHYSSHPRRKGKHRAFTLIELLVVIAIIAILAAILFPVFGRARENGRRASCQSNMKQVALGFEQYTMDFDERYPIDDVVNGTTNTGWAEALQPYLKSTQVMQCPSETQPYGNQNNWPPGSMNWPVDYNYTDYYYNKVFVAPKGLNSIPGNPGAQGPAKKSMLTYPTQTILIGDGFNGGSRYARDSVQTVITGDPESDLIGGKYDGSDWIPSQTVSPAERHLSGANYAFADGHVKWLKGEKIAGCDINGSADPDSSACVAKASALGNYFATFSVE